MSTRPDILTRIAPISERPPYLKVLFYGLPGAGKTVLAAGSPSPLFIDVEHGTRSLLNHPEFEKTEVLTVQSWMDVQEVFYRLREGARPDIKTVVIDSISELQKRQLDEHVKDAMVKDSKRVPHLPYQQDYLINTEIMRKMVINFRDLDRNLILIAHALEEKDESSGTLYWRPAITPKFASTLEGIVDLMGYLSLEVDKNGNQKRELQVMPSRRVKAKTRIGGLPPIIESPTFDILLQANQKKG